MLKNKRTKLNLTIFLSALLVMIITGCSPNDLESCRAAAVKMPTGEGVKVAIRDCHQKYVEEPAKIKKELETQEEKNRQHNAYNSLDQQTKQSIDKLSNEWENLFTHELVCEWGCILGNTFVTTDRKIKLLDVISRMGEPIEQDEPHSCNYIKEPSNSTKDLCRTYFWRSLKPTEKCVSEPEKAGEEIIKYREPLYYATFIEASGGFVIAGKDARPRCQTLISN